ncbi:MAG: arsenate reductase (glutaredoxin) [Acidimicrobiales bacterium]
MTDDVTIFHNPSCSKSRGALGILGERAIDARVVEYLVTPLTRIELEDIAGKLVGPVADLVRRGDPRFKELDLDPAGYRTAGEVIDLLLAHPELMERPVVVRGNRAVIARPPERLAEVLDPV